MDPKQCYPNDCCAGGREAGVRAVLERQVSLQEEEGEEGGREEWLIHTLGVPRYLTTGSEEKTSSSV
jgi:hypothetical protein